jgi:hypothetical protein
MPVHGLGGRRATLRISGDFVLRWADLVSDLFFGDHLEALVLNTVLRLNVHHVFEDPVLNLRYGGLEPPPDEERRPVTISEAARAMAMPRATTSRYVAGLLERGSFVARGRRGVIVPVRELVHDETRALTDANYLNAVQMMRRLHDRGLLPSAADSAGASPSDALRTRADRYRLVLRAAGEFVSDWMVPWNRHYQTGYLYGLVFIAILQANDRATEGAADGLVDADKKPISAHATALSLKLPPETVRRHALRLEADGLVARGASGLIVPRSAWDTPAGADVLAAAAEAVVRLDRVVALYQIKLSA